MLAAHQVVTKDATAAAGAAADCADNVRKGFKQLFAAGNTAEGRQQLQEKCRLCDPIADDTAVETLAYWVQVHEGLALYSRGCMRYETNVSDWIDGT